MSTKLYDQYYRACVQQLDAVMAKELGNIEKGAAWIADAVKKDQLVHVYGTGGHNSMTAGEMFTRAGALCNYNIWMPGGTPCFEAHPSTDNLPGMAKKVFDYYRPKSGEVLVLINVNGINATTIESAMEAKARGVKTIGISSRQFSEAVEPDALQRHPSKKNACDLVDLHIDTYTPVGDMVLSLDKIGRKTGASSTFPLTLIVNLLNARAVEMLVEQGITPDFLMSVNTKAGAEWSMKMRDKWVGRIKHM